MCRVEDFDPEDGVVGFVDWLCFGLGRWTGRGAHLGHVVCGCVWMAETTTGW